MTKYRKETCRNGSFRSLFMHADGADMLLMTVGFLGAVGEGIGLPAMLFYTSTIMNNIGDSSSLSSDVFTNKINQVNLILYIHQVYINYAQHFFLNKIYVVKPKPEGFETFNSEVYQRIIYLFISWKGLRAGLVIGNPINAVSLCYLAIVLWFACFLEGYCWSRTAQRQASRLRSAYLKAILRQEVAYFDLNVKSTVDVITSVSGDSLIIQEVISEKVPRSNPQEFLPLKNAIRRKLVILVRESLCFFICFKA
ncbi:putative ABC transporter type 1, transmembrane domain-containing protein [Helianthus annuus]|uniref:Putative ABC transporter type 1, transmembrane domain-containing protein n=1 Tax=Helianthus annuus TaxID=4232 RepID=A0A251SJQ5_HELAN|nr:putative Type I protein exporter [Helianthus annuus]KAJ0464816.1 putative ABC transporter type 1, transmembrane domain-containing protein [Helianthus annuus]KAJ0486410.1 putative ABC transporter type 1, transmembrane domain-containing protein [Helianthus annuus]KAJ0660559.1 putative ABC transporter type 1, transmembrane domain-containing protein [Helianthus annuus]KAJ0854547.1 putative ABC transporter type 1, transmembrane domain-containing protein [Helianthus annuus]